MINRYINKLWVAPLLGFAVVGCDEMLEENPVSTITPKNFYQNATDAITAVNGAYDAFHQGAYNGGRDYVFMIETPTPQVVARPSPRNVRGCFDVYMCLPSNSYVENSWEDIYQAINRANAVIDNVPGIKDMNAGLRARIVAEAKFLRALHYFTAVRNWGGLPIFAEETKSLKDLSKPRSPVSEVYDLIVKDLTEAQKDLPLSYPASEFGRATKGAAQTLLGKVFLQRAIAPRFDPYGDPLFWPTQAQPNDLQNAIAQLRAVAQSGVYSLVPNYGMMWNEATEINSEVIFSVQNAEYGGQGMTAWHFLAPRQSGWGGSWTSANATLPFWQSYPEGDARRPVTWLTEFVDTKGEKRVFNPDDPQNDNYPSEAPSLRKYLIERRDVSGWSTNPRDVILLRYADLLLMLAEAINEQNKGPTAEAVSLVNEVRQRAGVDPLSADLGYEGFREAIYWERNWELATEQHAWFDRQRFLDLFGAHVVAYSQLKDELPRRTVPQVKLTLQDLEWLMPIPLEAIERNPELSQNPGY